MKTVRQGLAFAALFGLLAVGEIMPQTRQAENPWARLNFLIGEWVGVGTGAPGEAVGGTSFSYALDKNIIIRKNWAKYPPKQGEKAGLSHEDLLVIYPGQGGASFRAIYFDNESHVINYLVSFPQNGDAVTLETDLADKGPRFRMTYELAPDRTLKNAFWIAAPGEDFKIYVQGTLEKKS